MIEKKLTKLHLDRAAEGDSVIWKTKSGKWVRGIVVAGDRVLPDDPKDAPSWRQDKCLRRMDAIFYKDI